MGIRRKRIDRAASYIANKSGGKDLVDFASTAMARSSVTPAQRKYVAGKTTGKQAIKSAGKVAFTAASVYGGGKVIKAGGKGLSALKRSVTMASRRKQTRTVGSTVGKKLPTKKAPNTLTKKEGRKIKKGYKKGIRAGAGRKIY